MIGKAHFSFDELLTALAEIEAVINSRPLSYISANDVEEPLTSSHLLVGRRILNLPDHLGHLDNLDDEDFSVDPILLTRRVKHLNSLLNHFWNRWRSEYLAELRESHYHSTQKTSDRKHPGLSVGEVVIVHDEHLPRGLWKLGRIQETLKGRDGQIRGAKVKMAKRDRQHDLLHQPIQLLYPIEACSHPDFTATATEDPNQLSGAVSPSESESTDRQENTRNCIPDTVREKQRCSQRATAQQADERRKACMYQLQDI